MKQQQLNLLYPTQEEYCRVIALNKISSSIQLLTIVHVIPHSFYILTIPAYVRLDLMLTLQVLDAHAMLHLFITQMQIPVHALVLLYITYNLTMYILVNVTTHSLITMYLELASVLNPRSTTQQKTLAHALPHSLIIQQIIAAIVLPQEF